MITKPKGTYDLYGEDGKNLLALKRIIDQIMFNYNYDLIRTPMFESSELFHRSVGETTDIVSKETYDFKDRGNRDMTLRPEGTAGVVRSFIENKWINEPDLPKKVYYFGSMFRYERPQAGRYREFTQFGIESLGSSNPMADAEVISVATTLFKTLGLKQIKVKINTLGDKESREKYREALKEHFRPHLNELCEDCNKRFENNPLRMLDCKVDKDKEVLKTVPKTIDFLNGSSEDYFKSVLKYLDELGIDYEIDTNIVRGLDYYSHTVFEIEANVEGFGSQNVLCGGGRYDGLATTLGGPEVPAVGFAMGVERILTAVKYEKIDLLEDQGLDVYIMPLDKKCKPFAFGLLNDLREFGLKADIDFKDRSFKANFKQVDRLEAKFVIIIGEDELKSKILTVKNIKTKQEDKVANEAIIEFINNNLDEVYE